MSALLHTIFALPRFGLTKVLKIVNKPFLDNLVKLFCYILILNVWRMNLVIWRKNIFSFLYLDFGVSDESLNSKICDVIMGITVY